MSDKTNYDVIVLVRPCAFSLRAHFHHNINFTNSVQNSLTKGKNEIMVVCSPRHLA